MCIPYFKYGMLHEVRGVEKLVDLIGFTRVSKVVKLEMQTAQHIVHFLHHLKVLADPLGVARDPIKGASAAPETYDLGRRRKRKED